MKIIEWARVSIDNMTFSRKLTTIALVFCAPILVLAFLLAREQQAAINFAYEEQQGIEMLPPLSRLLQHVQQHRGMSIAYLAGDQSFLDLIKDKQKEIDTDFDHALTTAETNRQPRLTIDLNHFITEWQSLKSKLFKSFTVEENATEQTKLISDHIFPLINLIAASSHLNQDPVLYNYYLIDSIVDTIPVLSEMLGQMRTYGLKRIVRGKLTDDESVFLRFLLNQAKTQLNVLDANFQEMVKLEQSMKPAVRTAWQNAILILTDFFNLFYEKLTVDGAEVPRVKKYYEEATNAVNSLYSLFDEALPQSKQLLQERINQLAFHRLITLLLAACITAIAIAFCFFVTRGLTHRLHEAVRIAESISQGDLTIQTPPEDSPDELNGLIQKLIQMKESLRLIIIEVINTSTTLLQSVSNITSSTASIAASMSSTTAAITETSTSIEEVRQVSRHATENAAHVLKNAQAVSEISDHGKALTDETISGIHSLQQQVALVLEKINQLSKQGQTIERIIMSVDELAKQSSLLAINALIEACNAGEHGEGFTVIAQEVQTLAHQSQNSTKQIRKILGDIERAIKSAVESTQKGNEAVEMGANKSIETGKYFVTLRHRIEDTTHAASLIVSSNEQQALGIEQLMIAMQRIIEESNRNSYGLKELETVTHNMSNIAGNLNYFINKYKV